MENPDTSTGWHSQTLYEIDPETGEMREMKVLVHFGMVVESIGDTIGCGEMLMVEYLLIQIENILYITFQNVRNLH